MKITKQTLLKDVTSLLTTEHFEKILDKIEIVDGKYQTIFSFTVGEFLMLLNWQEEFYRRYFEGKENGTVYEYAEKTKHLRSELKTIIDYLKRFDIRQTKEQEQASKGIDFPSFQESVLIFCIEKFNLKSFEEAEKTKVLDFLIMKKHQHAITVYEKNLRRILTPKKKGK